MKPDRFWLEEIKGGFRGYDYEFMVQCADKWWKVANITLEHIVMMSMRTNGLLPHIGTHGRELTGQWFVAPTGMVTNTRVGMAAGFVKKTVNKCAWMFVDPLSLAHYPGIENYSVTMPVVGYKWTMLWSDRRVEKKWLRESRHGH
jgi:hypothetical protein